MVWPVGKTHTPQKARQRAGSLQLGQEHLCTARVTLYCAKHRLGEWLAQHRLEPGGGAIWANNLPAAFTDVAPFAPAPPAGLAVYKARGMALGALLPLFRDSNIEAAAQGKPRLAGKPSMPLTNTTLLKGLALASRAQFSRASSAMRTSDPPDLATDRAFGKREALPRFNLLQASARGSIIRHDGQHATQAIGALIVILHRARKP
jgi:hypothetical protein